MRMCEHPFFAEILMVTFSITLRTLTLRQSLLVLEAKLNRNYVIEREILIKNNSNRLKTH
jgi:hypothetical protein